MNGVLIIDKPAGLTSHDVVNRARRILGQRSVGHLGTLDPMATGVLPLVVGSFTRLAQFYVSSEKTYEGIIRFGFSTDTYDAEGDPTSPQKNVILQKDQIESVAAKFRGVITQTPPPFSAKKIKGVPAYKLARKQKEVVLQPVQVEMKEFEILPVEADRARFRARVASGTYMRSVAHDMGQQLGCGAHLESLRRTSVAEFTLVDAHTLEELAAVFSARQQNAQSALQQQQGTMAKGGGFESQVEEPALLEDRPVEERPFEGRVQDDNLRAGFSPCGDELKAAPSEKNSLQPLHELFIHPRRLLPQFPSVTADEAAAARIRSGRTVNLPELSRARLVKVFSGQRELIAIATRVAGTLFHPKIVLCG